MSGRGVSRESGSTRSAVPSGASSVSIAQSASSGVAADVCWFGPTAKPAPSSALRSPLIDTEITGARGILLSIAGGNDLTLYEVNEAAEAVREASTDDTNIIFGATIDDRLDGQMWITVVATGIGGRTAGRRQTFVTAGSSGDLEPPAFLRDV